MHQMEDGSAFGRGTEGGRCPQKNRFLGKRLGPDQPIVAIGAAGFEPTTPTTPKWCATKLRYAPASRKLSQRSGRAWQRFRLSSQPRQQPCREAVAAQRGITPNSLAASQLTQLGEVEAGQS